MTIRRNGFLIAKVPWCALRRASARFQKIAALTVDSVSRQRKMYVDYKPRFVPLTAVRWERKHLL